MYFFKLKSYLVGYVVILVTGEMPEKFVNMAAGRGIYLWDITRIGDGAVIMKVSLSAVKPLRHIARRTGCRFHIRGRRGFPFYLARLRRRKSLVLGVVFFTGVLYFLSCFVWFIDVKGNERLSPAEVLVAAGEAGLRRGVPKWKVDTGRVEAELLERLPLMSWTGVYIKGARVTIEVAERVVPGEEDRRPAHIVAAKAGLIKEVLVLNGHPAVKEGDTVVPGQVLISGEIPPPEEEPKPGEKKEPGETPKVVRPSRYVHAKGIVRARVWYEGVGESEITETGQRLTGRSESRFSMKFDGKEIILSGNQNIPFEKYEVETFVKRLPEWRNLNVPVELVTVKYFELADYREERGREGALKLARERALGLATNQLPEGAGVSERWMEELIAGHSGNLVRVKAVIETVEDIGTIRIFDSEDDK